MKLLQSRFSQRNARCRCSVSFKKGDGYIYLFSSWNTSFLRWIIGICGVDLLRTASLFVKSVGVFLSPYHFGHQSTVLHLSCLLSLFSIRGCQEFPRNHKTVEWPFPFFAVSWAWWCSWTLSQCFRGQCLFFSDTFAAFLPCFSADQSQIPWKCSLRIVDWHRCLVLWRCIRWFHGSVV